MILKRFTISILIAVLIQSSAYPQTPEPSAVDKNQKEMEKKAAGLVDELVAEAMSLRLVENRIYVLTRAAEILWPHNEDRARSFLREAINQFAGIERPAGPDDPQAMFLLQLRMDLRTQLLQILAGRDSRLALDFLRNSRMPEAEKLTGGKGATAEFEQQFELQLAARIAENDPRMALQIAEENLKEGINFQVIEIWSNLLDKDSKSAARLSSEIVSKMRSADLIKNNQPAMMALSMLNVLRNQIQMVEKAAKESSASSKAQSQGASLAELQQTYREVMEIVVAAALKVTAGQLLDVQEQGQARNLLTQVQMLLPEIEKTLPARAAAVRAKLNQFDKAFHRPPMPPEPYEELMKKSPDELMALAAKSQPELKEVIYRQAAEKALEQGDTERARQILKDHISTGAFGDPIAAEIDRKERELALKQGKIEEARKSIARLRTEEERALALITLAANADSGKDRKARLELLAEAHQLLGDQMDTRVQVEAHLALANAYLDVDADRSFAILESAIDRLSVVLNAVMVLAKFDQNGWPFGPNAKEGEMRLHAGEFSNVTSNFDQQLDAFARKDFDRTVSALKRWPVTEIRLAMNLTLAEGILGEQKQTRYRPGFREHLYWK